MSDSKKVQHLKEENARLGTRLFAAEQRVKRLEAENRELYAKLQSKKQ